MVKERTRVVSLTFKRSELLYDIKNYAYVEGDVMKTGQEHDRHQVMDIGEDGNIDRVTRMLDLAFAHCVEECYPYTKIPVSEEQTGTGQDGYDMVTDDELKESDSYVMRLLLPDDFSQTTVTLLARLVHELLVCTVMADWLSITYPEKAETWSVKAEAAETEMRAMLNARCGRIRRTQSPF